MRWKVLAALAGLALFGGLWVAASALVATPQPGLGEVIRVGTPGDAPTAPDGPQQVDEPAAPDTPTPPVAATDGAVPVDTPQACLAGFDDDDDDCDDEDDFDDDDCDDDDFDDDDD